MVCYPEVQKEAQAELDNVLNGRLPEHSDFLSLPYISALVKEVYRYSATFSLISFAKSVSASSRWQPVAPTGRFLFLPHIDGNKLTSLFHEGVPHQSTDNDLYKNYHISANSLVIANQW